MGKALVMIVHACMLDAPTVCQDHPVRLTIQGGDPELCVYYSVREVAHWQQLNVKWKVKRWSCGYASEEELI